MKPRSNRKSMPPTAVLALASVLLMASTPAAAGIRRYQPAEGRYPLSPQEKSPKPVEVMSSDALKTAQIKERRYLDSRLAMVESKLRRDIQTVQTMRSNIEREKVLLAEVMRLERALREAERIVPPKQDPAIQAKLSERLKAAEAALVELRSKIAEALRHIEEEHEQEKQLHRYQALVDDAKKTMEDPKTKEKAQKLAQIQRDKEIMKADEAEIERLNAALKAAKEKLQTAQGNLASVNGAVAGVHAVFVECTSAGITIYNRTGADVSTTTVATEKIKDSTELKAIADEAASEAKSGGKEVLNFLVRPGGVKSYDAARQLAITESAPWSSVPISLTGKVPIGKTANAQNSETHSEGSNHG